EAMARARREFEIRVKRKSAAVAAGIFAAAAAAVSRLPPVGGKPVFGYGAALLAVAAGVFAIPIATDLAMRIASRVLPTLFPVQALLASRSLSGSLRRTSVLVAALSTAVSMTTAVAIMVGSFRQTVIAWMNSELPADLYLRPDGNPATAQQPLISPDFADVSPYRPHVRAVHR